MSACNEIVAKHFEDFQCNPSIWPEVFKLKLKDVTKMNIEELAKHADYVCKKMHEESKEIWRDFCLRSDSKCITEANIGDMNATGFANMAYVALNAPDDLKDNEVQELNRVLELRKKYEETNVANSSEEPDLSDMCVVM